MDPKDVAEANRWLDAPAAEKANSRGADAQAIIERGA
jgi:hypothetical protein